MIVTTAKLSPAADMLRDLPPPLSPSCSLPLPRPPCGERRMTNTPRGRRDCCNLRLPLGTHSSPPSAGRAPRGGLFFSIHLLHSNQESLSTRHARSPVSPLVFRNDAVLPDREPSIPGAAVGPDHPQGMHARGQSGIRSRFVRSCGGVCRTVCCVGSCPPLVRCSPTSCALFDRTPGG